MQARRKRHLGEHGSRDRQAIRDHRWSPPTEDTYLRDSELVRRQRFAKPPKPSPKRSFSELQDFQLQLPPSPATPPSPLPPPPYVYPTGETTSPVKLPGDPDDLMVDAPPVQHVSFEQPKYYAWLKHNDTRQAPKSILKERTQPYDILPDNYVPHLPEEGDLSEYAIYREAIDAEDEAEAKKAEAEKTAARKLAAREAQYRNFRSHINQPFSPVPGAVRKAKTSRSINAFNNQVPRPAFAAREANAAHKTRSGSGIWASPTRLTSLLDSADPPLNHSPLKPESRRGLQPQSRSERRQSSQDKVARALKELKDRRLNQHINPEPRIKAEASSSSRPATRPRSQYERIIEEDNEIETSLTRDSPNGPGVGAQYHSGPSTQYHTSQSRKSPSSLPKQVSPPRNILSPVSQRKSLSPSRPAITQLYPALQIGFVPTTSDPADNSSAEHVAEYSALRRIGGIFVGGLAYWTQKFFNGVVGQIFGHREPLKEEVIAVETNSTGRKRRAIAVSDMAENTSPPRGSQADEDQMMGFFEPGDGNCKSKIQRAASSSMSPCLPNTVAEVKSNAAEQQPTAVMQQASETLETPPDSRPGSSGSGGDDTRHGEKAEQPPREEDTHNPMFHATTDTEVAEIQKARFANLLRLPAEYHVKDPQWREPLPPFGSKKWRLISARNRRSESSRTRDQKVEDIIKRTKDITLQAKAEKLGKSQKSDKEPVTTTEEEIVQPSRDFKKEAQQQTQEEHERFRKQADAEAAQRALEEEKLCKAAAEEAAQRAAEEEALDEEKARVAAIKDQLVRPLDPEWEEKVQEAMKTSNAKHIITTTPDGVELTRYTLGKILPQKDASGRSLESNMKNEDGRAGPAGWLDDEAVNAILAMIVSRSKEQSGYVKGPNNAPEIEAYNSGWYTTHKSKGIQGIKSWSRRKGIQGEKLLKAKKIFFPVNTGAHWFLMVISPEERTIESFDSASTNSRITKAAKGERANQRFFDIMRAWLSMELGDKYIAEEWTDSDNSSTQQQNFDDCGIFTCMNALASSKGKQPSAVPSTNGMRDARKMMVAVLLNRGFHGDWEL